MAASQRRHCAVCSRFISAFSWGAMFHPLPNVLCSTVIKALCPRSRGGRARLVQWSRFRLIESKALLLYVKSPDIILLRGSVWSFVAEQQKSAPASSPICPLLLASGGKC